MDGISHGYMLSTPVPSEPVGHATGMVHADSVQLEGLLRLFGDKNDGFVCPEQVYTMSEA